MALRLVPDALDLGPVHLAGRHRAAGSGVVATAVVDEAALVESVNGQDRSVCRRRLFAGVARRGSAPSRDVYASTHHHRLGGARTPSPAKVAHRLRVRGFPQLRDAPRHAECGGRR